MVHSLKGRNFVSYRSFKTIPFKMSSKDGTEGGYEALRGDRNPELTSEPTTPDDHIRWSRHFEHASSERYEPLTEFDDHSSDSDFVTPWDACEPQRLEDTKESGYQDAEETDSSPFQTTDEPFEISYWLMNFLLEGKYYDMTGVDESPSVSGHKSEYTCVHEIESGIWILIPDKVLQAPVLSAQLRREGEPWLRTGSYEPFFVRKKSVRVSQPSTHETKPAEKPTKPVFVSDCLFAYSCHSMADSGGLTFSYRLETSGLETQSSHMARARYERKRKVKTYFIVTVSRVRDCRMRQRARCCRYAQHAHAVLSFQESIHSGGFAKRQ